MPMIETPDEFAEELADLFGVYGAHPRDGGCKDDPRVMCRVCLVSYVADRMRTTVKNEAALRAFNS